MEYSLGEIEQLERLLDAEAAGEPFNRRLCRELAELLAEQCPDIRLTMLRVSQRMAA